MKNIEYRTIDKSSWQRGGWDNEPDKKQWLDEDTGFPCLIKRNRTWGVLCGYVGVNKNHSLYEKNYDEAHTTYDISVHGGLTYSDKCNGNEEDGICHVVEENEDGDIWWFGFDCAHSFDINPAYSHRLPPFPDEAYRDFKYVEDEVKKLALQLRKTQGEIK